MGGQTIHWNHARLGLQEKAGALMNARLCKKALEQFEHSKPTKRQDAHFPHTPQNYGAIKQYAKSESTAPALDKKDKQFIQQVCGKFLFYGRAVDSTVLTPISTIASQQDNPTEETMAQTKQLLDYLASQEEAVLTYLRLFHYKSVSRQMAGNKNRCYIQI